MENITLNVGGMSCGHCVKAVNVNLEAGEVAVAYEPGKVSVEQIKEAIDEQGYDVK